MADPFNATAGAGSDSWQNLMAFGLATMAAGSQPGAKFGGAVGQGGLAAMQQSRENAAAAGQQQYLGAETRSKNLANQIGLTQINYQRQLMGQPPLDPNGMPTQQQTSVMQSPQSGPAADASIAAPSASADTSTPNNSAGMNFSPTAGSSARPPQSFSQPSDGASPQNAPYSPQQVQQLLQGIYTGKVQATPEIARIVAPTAAAMGLPIAGKLQDMAYNPITAGATKQAEAPYEFHDVRDGGALFQGQTPIAYGGMTGVAPDGTSYKIPAHSATQGGQFSIPGQPGAAPVVAGAITQAADTGSLAGNPNMPLGIRNNNPTNIRPTGDQWQGMTGQNGGYLQFKTPEDGIRAATLNLQNYNQRGWNTPLTIAEHWAPKGDGKNNPTAYGVQLANTLGIDPGQSIDLSNPQAAAAVIHGISHIENSGVVPYSPQQIQAGVNSAFQVKGGPAASAPSVSAKGAAGIPAGAIQTGIGPAQEGYLKTRGDELGKKQGEWDTQAQSAIQNNFTLDQMRNESQSWRMGKWADNEAQARTYLQGFAGVMGADKTQFDKPLGDYQAFNKSAGQLTREAVRETSSKAAFQEFQMIQKQLPSAEMAKGGFNTIVNQMQGVNDYKIARQTAAQNWMQSHPTLDGFEVDFNKNVTPGVFLLQRMAQNNPQDFKQMWSNMQKDPKSLATLDDLVRKRNYALQNGLFE